MNERKDMGKIWIKGETKEGIGKKGKGCERWVQNEDDRKD